MEIGKSTAAERLSRRVPNGVYVQDTQHNLWRVKDWSDRPASERDPNAIAVVGQSYAFRIALRDLGTLQIHSTSEDESWETSLWNLNDGRLLCRRDSGRSACLGSDGKEISGYSDFSIIGSQFHGMEDTRHIARLQPSEDYAAAACLKYKFPDGHGGAYLPSVGELSHLFDYKIVYEEVSAALRECDGAHGFDVDRFSYWTSTYWGKTYNFKLNVPCNLAYGSYGFYQDYLSIFGIVRPFAAMDDDMLDIDRLMCVDKEELGELRRPLPLGRDELKEGSVYIQDINGHYYNVADWDRRWMIPNAIAVVDTECSFRVSLGWLEGVALCRKDCLDTPLVGPESWDSDFDGIGNTRRLLEAQGLDTDTSKRLRAACKVTFPDGVTEGYIPSFGEVQELYSMKPLFDTACFAVAADRRGLLPDNCWWTSTFMSRDAWPEKDRFLTFSFDNGVSYGETVDSENCLVPFAPL